MIKYICPCCDSHFRLNEFKKYDDGSKTKEAQERAKRHQEKKDAFAKRNSEIYDKREQGVTHSKLAYEFGLSAQRVRQICFREPTVRAKRHYEQTAKSKFKGISFYSWQELNKHGIKHPDQVEPWLNAMDHDIRHNLCLFNRQYQEILTAWGLFIDPTTKQIERIDDLKKIIKGVDIL